MRKITLLLGAVCMIALASCKKETTTETTETEVVPTSTTDTVVVEKEVPAAPAPENTDGTSIKVDGNGVDIQSKDGKNSTDVEVKDGGAAVEIKK